MKLLSSDATWKKWNVQNQLLLLFFFLVDEMITQEKIQKLLFYFWGQIAKVLKLAIKRKTKFRNTQWPETSFTIVEDKPWILFCKTSLNARESLFSKSVDKKCVALWDMAKKVQKGISDSDKLKYYKCVEILALQARGP